jgi:ankyrin repeat protein
VEKENLDAVKLLVEYGADIDAVGPKKKTAISMASLKDTSILEFLLKKSSRHINTCDTSGWYPLHFAVKTGNLDAIKLLISYGADINVYTSYRRWYMAFGETPLAYAVSMAHVRIVEYLLENQADVNKGTIDSSGKKTVIQAMCYYKKFFNHADFGIHKLKEKKYEMIALLGRYGAEINQDTIKTIMRYKKKTGILT